MLKVRDLMSQVVVSVAVDDSAASAAEILARAGISGAPVRDEFGDLVGIISHADLTNQRLAGGRQNPTVADLMTPDRLGVYADDPALAAATEMAQHDIHRVMVWDADGKIVGIVTSLDLVKAIARGEQFAVDSSTANAREPNGNTTRT
jgi:CBS-domain-containing membrane protein